MSKTICRICLRTNIETRNIDGTLTEFHDEITEYDVYESAYLKYCSICEHLLRKFLNFTHKCRSANKLLKNFKKRKGGLFPSNLYEKIPQTPLVSKKLPVINIFEGDVFIKQEVNDINNFNANENDFQILKSSEELMIKDEGSPQTDKKQEIFAIEFIKNADPSLTVNQEIKQDNDFNDGTEFEIDVITDEYLMVVDTNDDVQIIAESNDCGVEIANISDALEGSQQDSKYQASALKTFSENCLKNEIEPPKSIDSDNSSETDMLNDYLVKLRNLPAQEKPRRKRKIKIKKPPTYCKEFEKVFDIKLFATVQEAKDEIEQRKTSEWYLSAEHKCDICYMVFRWDKLVKYHMRWHDPSAGEHVCEICQMRFPTRRAYKNHHGGAHSAKFKCKLCPMITYQRTTVQGHFLMHEGVTFTCDICSHTFKHRQTFLNHRLLTHQTKHVCTICGRSFKSELGLQGHRTRVHKNTTSIDANIEVPTRCKACDIMFANEQAYTVHILKTKGHELLAGDIIGCKMCGARFNDKDTLLTHKHTMHPRRGALTGHPARAAGTNNDVLVLRSLLKVSTPGKNKKTIYSCSLCGTEVTNLMRASRHMRDHHPDSVYSRGLKQRKQHMCDVCGKCFTTVNNLEEHMNIHKGLKPFACKLCPARFSSRLGITSHAQWHKPAKRECKVCGKKFVSSAGLGNHMRSHIQDRRFKCSVCQKGFIHSCALREHVRYVHHQERRVRKPRDAPRVKPRIAIYPSLTTGADPSSKPPTKL